MRFELEQNLLEGVDERRREELAQALEDLNQAPQPTVLGELAKLGGDWVISLGGLTSSGITFGILNQNKEADPAGNVDIRVVWASLRTPMKEYQEIIESIVSTGMHGGRGRYEAMDYGKKVVHDEAGEILQELLDEHLDVSLATARNLFTLLFLLRTDLPAHVVQYHRTHL